MLFNHLSSEESKARVCIFLLGVCVCTGTCVPACTDAQVGFIQTAVYLLYKRFSLWHLGINTVVHQFGEDKTPHFSFKLKQALLSVFLYQIIIQIFPGNSLFERPDCNVWGSHTVSVNCATES